jgi:DNA replication initiation complex subunit (GINS family)
MTQQDTYQELFQAVQNEKGNSDLQKINVELVNDSLKFLAEMQDKVGVVSFDEDAKLRRIIDNSKRLLKELYERREKKVMAMAIDKSRTKTFLIDTTAMLQEEKIMFESIVKLLDSFRDPKMKQLESIQESAKPMMISA